MQKKTKQNIKRPSQKNCNISSSSGGGGSGSFVVSCFTVREGVFQSHPKKVFWIFVFFKCKCFQLL